MAARVVAYKPPTVSQCAEEGHVYEMFGDPQPRGMAAPAVVYKPPTVSQGEGHVYEVQSPPLSPITPKPAPSDRQRQKLLVTAIVGVFLVAGCLLGLLAAIVVRIPASGDRQGAVNQELVRSPIECPVACPSVLCPELACPSVPCPELACPSVPCPELACPSVPCPSVSCPELVCPSVSCPELACPSVPSPELACPSVPCPQMACPSVPCPELVCPSVSCPELACPSVPCPEVACPSVPCPALTCPSVPCPELGCPSVPCPQLTCPSVDISCPAISCPIMSPVTSCDDGFVRRDGSNSCYKVINVAKTRPEAAAECARHGAYLVEIGSQEEQTFIERLIAPFDSPFWIGGIRLPPASSSTFIWEHSKQIIAEGVTFTNWKAGQPEETGQNCMGLYYESGWQWHDLDVNRHHTKVACEKSLL